MKRDETSMKMGRSIPIQQHRQSEGSMPLQRLLGSLEAQGRFIRETVTCTKSELRHRKIFEKEKERTEII